MDPKSQRNSPLFFNLPCAAPPPDLAAIDASSHLGWAHQ
jgi:hypothetical protein